MSNFRDHLTFKDNFDQYYFTYPSVDNKTKDLL